MKWKELLAVSSVTVLACCKGPQESQSVDIVSKLVRLNQEQMALARVVYAVDEVRRKSRRWPENAKGLCHGASGSIGKYAYMDKNQTQRVEDLLPRDFRISIRHAAEMTATYNFQWRDSKPTWFKIDLNTPHDPPKIH